MRAVKGSLGHSSKERYRELEDPRWTRAVGDPLACPQGRRCNSGGRSMRAMETTPAASLNAGVVKS